MYRGKYKGRYVRKINGKKQYIKYENRYIIDEYRLSKYSGLLTIIIIRIMMVMIVLTMYLNVHIQQSSNYKYLET